MRGNHVCRPSSGLRVAEGTHHKRFMDQACVTAYKSRENVALFGNVFRVEESWR
jgi:hypothetical protein